MRMTVLLTLLAVLFSNCQTNPKVLYDSEVINDPTLWVVEQQAGGQVLFHKDSIEILDSSGCTVWFKPELEGSLQIEYTIRVVDNQGPYDRVSDMNVFWMAKDPLHPEDLFYKGHNRQGQFRQYDSLELYYVGCGGHNNTRTRFRRYNGTIKRPLEPQHDLDTPDVLLTPNHTYTVQLIANGHSVKYIRDGKIIFELQDPEPYIKGRIGFRVYKSHQVISTFKVLRLE